MQEHRRAEADQLARPASRTAHGIDHDASRPSSSRRSPQRCTEAETGARNVDHILRGSLMPAMASACSRGWTSSTSCATLDVGLDPTG